jgi:methionyl-tRNA synthetase
MSVCALLGGDGHSEEEAHYFFTLTEYEKLFKTYTAEQMWNDMSDDGKASIMKLITGEVHE